MMLFQAIKGDRPSGRDIASGKRIAIDNKDANKVGKDDFFLGEVVTITPRNGNKPFDVVKVKEVIKSLPCTLTIENGKAIENQKVLEYKSGKWIFVERTDEINPITVLSPSFAKTPYSLTDRNGKTSYYEIGSCVGGLDLYEDRYDREYILSFTDPKVLEGAAQYYLDNRIFTFDVKHVVYITKEHDIIYDLRIYQDTVILKTQNLGKVKPEYINVIEGSNLRFYIESAALGLDIPEKKIEFDGCYVNDFIEGVSMTSRYGIEASTILVNPRPYVEVEEYPLFDVVRTYTMVDSAITTYTLCGVVLQVRQEKYDGDLRKLHCDIKVVYKF